jgi:hypothetical protein
MKPGKGVSWLLAEWSEETPTGNIDFYVALSMIIACFFFSAMITPKKG